MPSLKNHSDLMNKVFNMDTPTTHEQLQRWRDSLPKPPVPIADQLAFGFTEYGAGGSELLNYLDEKREMGIVEEVTGSAPPDVKVTVLTNVGTYRGVLEPWLHDYVIDHTVVCEVVANYIGGYQVTRRELRALAAHFKISVRMTVTPCFKGQGVFTYVGPDYRYVAR